MAKIEQRIEKLERMKPTGEERITEIRHLIISPTDGCVSAFRRIAPNWERTEIIGAEFEAIRRGTLEGQGQPRNNRGMAGDDPAAQR